MGCNSSAEAVYPAGFRVSTKGVLIPKVSWSEAWDELQREPLLKLAVLESKDLESEDLFTESDPYIIIQLRDERKELIVAYPFNYHYDITVHQQMRRNEKDCAWNGIRVVLDALSDEFKRLGEVRFVDFQVWDRDRCIDDDLIGIARLALNDEDLVNGVDILRWVDLVEEVGAGDDEDPQVSRGQLLVRIQLVTEDKRREAVALEETRVRLTRRSTEVWQKRYHNFLKQVKEKKHKDLDLAAAMFTIGSVWEGKMHITSPKEVSFISPYRLQVVEKNEDEKHINGIKCKHAFRSCFGRYDGIVFAYLSEADMSHDGMVTVSWVDREGKSVTGTYRAQCDMDDRAMEGTVQMFFRNVGVCEGHFRMVNRIMGEKEKEMLIADVGKHVIASRDHDSEGDDDENVELKTPYKSIDLPLNAAGDGSDCCDTSGGANEGTAGTASATDEKELPPIG